MAEFGSANSGVDSLGSAAADHIESLLRAEAARAEAARLAAAAASSDDSDDDSYSDDFDLASHAGRRSVIEEDIDVHPAAPAQPVPLLHMTNHGARPEVDPNAHLPVLPLQGDAPTVKTHRSTTTTTTARRSGAAKTVDDAVTPTKTAAGAAEGKLLRSSARVRRETNLSSPRRSPAGASGLGRVLRHNTTTHTTTTTTTVVTTGSVHPHSPRGHDNNSSSSSSSSPRATRRARARHRGKNIKQPSSPRPLPRVDSGKLDAAARRRAGRLRRLQQEHTTLTSQVAALRSRLDAAQAAADRRRQRADVARSPGHMVMDEDDEEDDEQVVLEARMRMEDIDEELEALEDAVLEVGSENILLKHQADAGVETSIVHQVKQVRA